MPESWGQWTYQYLWHEIHFTMTKNKGIRNATRPFDPTSPRTWPGRGRGSLWSLKELGPNRCVVSFSKDFGRFIISIASKGHFFTQIPHPMQRVSDMYAILSLGLTSTQSFPMRTTGHCLLHSCRHFLGLHCASTTGKGPHGAGKWVKVKHHNNITTIQIVKTHLVGIDHSDTRKFVGLVLLGHFVFCLQKRENDNET